jgi:hypothetical protein
VYIQIVVMERDIHGALLSDPPGEEAAHPHASRSEKHKQRANDYTVIVAMPDPLPVTEGELELLESELADFIAELLKK